MSSKSWDARQGWKLTVLVDQATLDTVKKHGGEDTRNSFATLRMVGIKNRQQQKTHVLKHTVNPQWREVFFFEVPRADRRKGDGEEDIDEDADDGAAGEDGKRVAPRLEVVVSDSGIMKHHIGTAIVDFKDLQEDAVVKMEKKLRKEVKDKKKKDGDPSDDGKKGPKKVIVGTIHLFLHLSRMRWVPRPRPFGPQPDRRFVYLYDRSLKQFHPGDIVLYSTPGPAAALLRVETEVQWSHCGIVVEMPNKWTNEPELHVFEFCSNREDVLDAYNERPIHNGPMSFRLAERIHGFHGTEAWLMPLTKPLSRPQVQSLTEWALGLISDFNKGVTMKYKDDRTAPSPFGQFQFNATGDAYLNKVGVRVQNHSAYCEYFSPEVAAIGLCYAGIQVQKKGKVTLLKELTCSNNFSRPFLIRCRNRYAETPEWPYLPPEVKESQSPAQKADEALKEEKPQQVPPQDAAAPQLSQTPTTPVSKPPVPTTPSRKRIVPSSPPPERPKTSAPNKTLPVPQPKPPKDDPAAAAEPGECKHLISLLQSTCLFTNLVPDDDVPDDDVPDDEPKSAVTGEVSGAESTEEVDEKDLDENYDKSISEVDEVPDGTTEDPSDTASNKTAVEEPSDTESSETVVIEEPSDDSTELTVPSSSESSLTDSKPSEGMDDFDDEEDDDHAKGRD